MAKMTRFPNDPQKKAVLMRILKESLSNLRNKQDPF
jgi:hypothetical protein